jgi:hypothetical protein
MATFAQNSPFCVAPPNTIADNAFTCETIGMSKLILRYEPDPGFFDPKLSRDDFGRLSVAVETDHFSGKGGFWVQWQDVSEFCEALRTFPIPEDKPIIMQFGYDKQEGDDLIIRFEIAPADRRGNLAVLFEVADDYKPRDRVRGCFVTNYPDLDAFRTGIAQLMNNEAEEAILTGR